MSQAIPIELSVDEQFIALLPQTPAILVELDVQRMRDNSKLGSLWTRVGAVLDTVPVALSPEISKLSPKLSSAQFLPMRDATRIVWASYEVGLPSAYTVTLIESKVAPDGVTALGDNRYVVGPDGIAAEVLIRAQMAKPATSLHLPLSYRQLRDRARPRGARATSARIVFDLDDNARESLATTFSLSIPKRVSAWFDLVDDAALVIAVSSVDAIEQDMWRAELETLFGKAGESEWARAGGIATSFAHADVAVKGDAVVGIVVITPKRLDQALARASTAFEAWFSLVDSKNKATTP